MIPFIPSVHIEQLASLFNAFAPGAIICVVALAFCRTAAKHNPTVRYIVCLVSLVCVLISPLIAVVSQKVGFSFVNIPLTRNSGMSASAISNSLLSHATDFNRTGNAQNGESIVRFCVQNGGYFFLFVWIAGIVVGVSRLLKGLRETSFIAQEACVWEPTMDAETKTKLECLARGVLPAMYTSLRVFTPVAIGVMNPMVIVPEELAKQLSPAELRHVLLHECAHIAFKHASGAILERASKIIFWFHPLVRVTCNELARAREEVCDNVASQESGAACYARTLLTIAQGDFTAPNYASALSLLGPGTSLEARIAGLLHPRRNRMIHMKKWMIWSLGGVALSAMCLTTLVRVVAADTKSRAADHNPKALNNKQNPKPGTSGAALDNRMSSEDLRVSAKLDASKPDLRELLDASKLDESSKRVPLKLSLRLVPSKLENKSISEKYANGKAPSGTYFRSLATVRSTSEEHAAKLKAEAESLARAPLTNGTAPVDRLDGDGTTALKLKLDAERLANHK